MKKLFVLLVTLISINSAYAQGCLPEGIIVTTQEEIDNFQTNYPGCTSILGRLLISGNVTNLNGLSVLTSVGGDLIINSLTLTSLSGLEGLISIGGGLYIFDNKVLTSISDLNSLTSIETDIQVNLNDSLTSLSGLDGVTSVRSLYIYDNPFLTNLLGLEGLKSIIFLEIGNNSSLTSLVGLENVNTVQEYLGIINNDALTNLSGLEGLTSVSCLYIGNNNALTSLTGLDNITFTSDITIEENNTLSSLAGLTGVSSLGGAGGISINSNGTLTSLSGLDNIDAGTIIGLSITNNYFLSSCDIKSVCDFLGIPNADVSFNNNAPGCSSIEEVSAACAPYINETNFSRTLIIHPNPFATSITIEYELKSPERVVLTFYNHLGELVDKIEQNQTQGLNTVVWNAESFPTGIYHFRLQAGEQMASGKMVLMK